MDHLFILLLPLVLKQRPIFVVYQWRQVVTTSVVICWIHTQGSALSAQQFRMNVGRSENLGGGRCSCYLVGIICPLRLVKIGLTDLSKYIGALSPLALTGLFCNHRDLLMQFFWWARACPTFHDGRLVTFLNRDRFGYTASFIMPLLLLLHSGNFYMFSLH